MGLASVNPGGDEFNFSITSKAAGDGSLPCLHRPLEKNLDFDRDTILPSFNRADASKPTWQMTHAPFTRI